MSNIDKMSSFFEIDDYLALPNKFSVTSDGDRVIFKSIAPTSQPNDSMYIFGILSDNKTILHVCESEMSLPILWYTNNGKQYSRTVSPKWEFISTCLTVSDNGYLLDNQFNPTHFFHDIYFDQVFNVHT